MDRKDFSRALSQHSLPQVLLFEGEEEHLKQEALAELRHAVLPEGMETLNETILEDPSVDQLIADVETQPFMADKRLIIVRDLPALMGRSEADERLIAYLPSVPETSFFCCQFFSGSRKRM